jgi:hypothetical protein
MKTLSARLTAVFTRVFRTPHRQTLFLAARRYVPHAAGLAHMGVHKG